MYKDYRERYKAQYGYTDEMLVIDDFMEEACQRHYIVHIVDHDGIEYTGKASGYCKADDEDDGFATMCIDTTDKGGWCLGVNEIASIEKLDS
ncbi:MAG: Rho-binding antiterminator [Ruminococcus sp.]|nr:Rho-binding antiterminator [Ruminococcus sp.]